VRHLSEQTKALWLHRCMVQTTVVDISLSRSNVFEKSHVASCIQNPEKELIASVRI